MKLNKRDQAILSWVKKHRPKDLETFKKMLDDRVWMLVVAMAFEAGREFQYKNPDMERGPAVVY